ncbi:DNA/RNA helicase [Caudoviricetes sp.]|nr:DNA/RNA helicase [Caudoviricetes sp.]
MASDIYCPHSYQEEAEQWVMTHPMTSLWLDMGLGKTVSTLSAIARLRRSGAVRAVLVVGPLRVIEDTWPDEIAKWWHTEHLTTSHIRGNVSPRTVIRKNPDGSLRETMTKPSTKGLSALATRADIYLVSYDVLPALAQWCAEQKGDLPFDMIVWDESSKMKNASARRFKLMKPVLGRMKRGVLLTGTPAPQNYIDLWSQYFLIDRGARLGQFVTHFKDRHFEAIDRYGYTLRMRNGAKETIERAISDVTLCMRAEDHLDMPALVENDIMLELPPHARKVYDDLEAELASELMLGDAVAVSEASLVNKCRQVASGAIYLEERDKTWEQVHDAKLDALADIIDDAQGTPILVAYEFRHDIERLLRRWPKAPWIGGGSKDASGAIKAWNTGTVPVMFVHPASVGHGINLQHGGHILVWFTLTWSLELYQQTVARLYRQGQAHRSVIIHRILMKNTVDTDVRSALRTKDKGQSALKEAIRLRIT